MPNGRKVTSQAQAALIGMVAGGGHPDSVHGLSQEQAQDMTRGVKVNKLPEHSHDGKASESHHKH